MDNKKTGTLFVLSGPSGAGKDAVMFKLLDTYPEFRRIITTTTREPRPNEIQNQDYHFVTKPEFEKLIQDQKLIEYVEYDGNFYGTTKNEIENVLNGQNTIWRIDPSRAAKVKELLRNSFDPETAQKLISNLTVVYLMVNVENRRHRLENRDYSEEKLQSRLKEDQMVWDENKDNYQLKIDNNRSLEKTMEEIKQILSHSGK